jgi:hypothetical protein
MWDELRIGGGAPPIETPEGWLEIYHGVSSDGSYHLGALLLDLDDPSRVIAPVATADALSRKRLRARRLLFEHRVLQRAVIAPLCCRSTPCLLRCRGPVRRRLQGVHQPPPRHAAGKDLLMRSRLPAMIMLAGCFASAAAQQIAVPRIEAMPAVPSPLTIPDWRSASERLREPRVQQDGVGAASSPYLDGRHAHQQRPRWIRTAELCWFRIPNVGRGTRGGHLPRFPRWRYLQRHRLHHPERIQFRPDGAELL